MLGIVNESSIFLFYLGFLRVLAFWISWPVLSGNTVPVSVKILLSGLVAFLLLPASLSGAAVVTWTPSVLVVLSLKELFLGLLLGLICRLFSFAIGMGGHLISVTIGLAQGQLYNPQLGHQTNPFEEFYMLVGSLFFLMIKGHHLFLSGFALSFQEVHVLQMVSFEEGMKGVLPFFLTLLTVCVQIAAPVLVTILFLNISMGIIGRAVPQINVLITSLPLNILAGLIIVIVALPLTMGFMDQFHLQVAEQLFVFIKGL